MWAFLVVELNESSDTYQCVIVVKKTFLAIDNLRLQYVSRLQLCNDSIQAAITVPIYIMLRRFISYLLLTNLSLLSLSVHRCYCLLSHHHPDRWRPLQTNRLYTLYRFFQASCNWLRPRDYNSSVHPHKADRKYPNLSAMSSAHDNANVPAVHR